MGGGWSRKPADRSRAYGQILGIDDRWIACRCGGGRRRGDSRAAEWADRVRVAVRSLGHRGTYTPSDLGGLPLWGISDCEGN